MAQTASLILQGLQLGGQHGQQEYLRKQQAVQQARQLAEAAAARRALRKRYDQLAPPPAQYLDKPMGTGPGEGTMGPVQQLPNPDFENAMGVRSAMADPNMPVDILDQMVGAEEGIARAQRLATFKQQLEEKDFGKEMALLEGARKLGITPRQSKRVGMVADKYGIGPEYFDPMSPETVQGVMNRDPGAIAQMLQRGGIPAGLMPGANVAGEITPEMMAGSRSGDPAQMAAVANALHGRLPSTMAPQRPNGTPRPSPEDLAAQIGEEVAKFRDSGMDLLPHEVAQLADYTEAGRVLPDAFYQRVAERSNQPRKAEASMVKLRIKDAEKALTHAESLYGKVLSDARYNAAKIPEAQRGVITARNEARLNLQNLQNRLQELSAPSFTQPAPAAPGPRAGVAAPGPTGSSGVVTTPPRATLTPEQAIDRAMDELGPDATDEAVAARAREMMGAPR